MSHAGQTGNDCEQRAPGVGSSEMLADLELTRSELQQVRQSYVAEKLALVEKLGAINARCKTRLPNDEFHRLQSKRGQLVKEMARVEKKLAEMNAGAVSIQATIDIRKRTALAVSDVRHLVAIRDRWHDYSMDKANHQKAREVAWKVSQELKAFLKHYFDPSANNDSATPVADPK